MASLIQVARNVLSQRDPLLPNETKRIVMKELLQAKLNYLSLNQSFQQFFR